jgi:hypothetical protein
MDFSKQDGTPSVKLHHAPGGKSSFSLAWDAEPTQVVGKSKPNIGNQKNASNIFNEPQKSNNVQTSVKVHAPPGGKSNIVFG